MAPRLISVAVSLALSVGATSAYAQSSASGVEEVTVTARKRPESSQNVDISMSVIDADTINSLRLRNLPEVAAYTQNIALFEDFPGAGIPTWFIRGVGLQDFNSNNTPTAGVYVDGNYQVATVMGTTSLYDVSQVEILKGPQGGLYGRNTSGGAVLVNSNRAVVGQRDGSIQVGYGSWDQALAEGMINIPIGQDFAWRLAGRAENSSGGWQKVIATGEEHGAKDRWDMRSWLTWDPGTGFSAQWKLQGGADDSEIALSRSIGVYDNTVPGKQCLPITQGRRDDTTCINFGGSNRIRYGLGAPEKLADQADDGSLVFSDPLNSQSNDYIDSVLELKWALGELELLSITTYDNYDYGVALDLDGSRGEYGHRFSTSDIEVMSQELRLLSSANSALHWMLGLNVSHEEFREGRDFKFRDNRLIPIPFGLGKLFYEQDTRAAAFYVDLSYELSDNWTINSAFRYTDEEKKYRNGDFYIPVSNPIYFVRNASSDYSLDKPFSGSLSLNFAPRENSFLYAKVSEGFKSGGFYGGFPFYASEIAPYKEETITAWETGYKQAWPEQSLNLAAAVFLYDYRDVQGFVSSQNALTGTSIEQLRNQGDALHRGVEVDVDWQPAEQISLSAGLGWLSAEIRDSAVVNENIAGDEVLIGGDRPYAPRWSGNVLGKYRQTVGAEQSLEWVLGYHYRSEFAGNQTSLVDAAVNKLPGYGVFDVSATLRKNTGRWDTTFWVKNLMDKTYRTRVKDDGLNSFVEFFGEPRSIGITALLRFND